MQRWLIVGLLFLTGGCETVDYRRAVYAAGQQAGCVQQNANLPDAPRRDAECHDPNRPGAMSYEEYQRARTGQ